MEIPSSRQKASTDPVRRSNRQSRSRHRTRSASLTDRAIAISPELNSEESLEASQVTGAIKNGCGWRLRVGSGGVGEDSSGGDPGVPAGGTRGTASSEDAPAEAATQCRNGAAGRITAPQRLLNEKTTARGPPEGSSRRCRHLGGPSLGGIQQVRAGDPAQPSGCRTCR
jgi:hypothetical protein